MLRSVIDLPSFQKKAQDPDGPPLITFRGVLGILEPFVWCNAHILEQNRIVWGPCDASEGEVSAEQEILYWLMTSNSL